MEIADSARKHRIADLDIHHAVRHSIRAVRQGGDRVLFIGPDRAGVLLEIVALDGDTDDDPPTAIHAMPLRRKFRHHLR